MQRNNKDLDDLRRLEEELVVDVLKSRKLSLFTGEYSRKIESALNTLFRGRYSLVLNSGTAAIHLALECLGIGPGDEIILPAITYPATALAVTYVGATPVFADIDPYNLTLDVKSCENCISRKTKGIIFVHLFGATGNIRQVTEICDTNNILLIEDCAQAFGSKNCGQMAGTFGNASCYSFFESKTVSAGEGGAILFEDQRLLELGRRYRHHGMDTETGSRSVTVRGYNYKPSEFQSAIALAQVMYHDKLVELRKRIVSVIKRYLPQNMSYQKTAPNEEIVYDKLCLLFGSDVERKYAEQHGKLLGFRRYMNRPLYEEPVFEVMSHREPCPVAEKFSRQHLIWQVSPYLAYHEIEIIAKKFTRYYKGGFK